MQNSAFANTARRFLAASLLAALATTNAEAANLTWNLSGAGAWDTGSLNWTDGSATLAWNNANNDNATFGTLASNATVTLGTDITVNNLTFGSSTGVNVLAGSAGRSITVNGTLSNSRTATVTAVIAGSNGFTKAGSSTLILQAVNTYTGPTIIQSATLQTRTTGALPTSTTVTIGNSASSATLDVRADQTIAGIAKGGTGTSTITQSQAIGTTTLTIDPDGAGVSAADSTFSGTITDNAGTGRLLALTKAGGNTLTLTGINNYAGATTVSGGTLKLGSSLNASSGVIISGGTLAGDDTTSPVALGTGAVSMSGVASAITPGGIGTAGSFTLAANQNFSTTAGTLNFDIGGAFDQIVGSGTGFFDLADTTLALSGATSIAGTYQLFSGFGGANLISNLAITGLDSGFIGTLDATGLLTITATAIPEPATAAALVGAFSLAIVAGRRRRA